ncbi:hypothetical protein ACIBHY_20280 [Nonomuraea sp. NPDC050547]|uniref:hypothetical protein n=1 Tax=unclassified Nonomuraea TaxID=2593643 RepID=UPI0037BE1AC8
MRGSGGHSATAIRSGADFEVELPTEAGGLLLPSRYYAPWRNDPRPWGGLFQGRVSGFRRRQRRHEQGPAELTEFYRWREAAEGPLSSRSNTPTSMGTATSSQAGSREVMSTCPGPERGRNDPTVIATSPRP